MTENGSATSRELGRPHPEERACRKGCANSNGRARVSRDEDGTRSRVYPRSAELNAQVGYSRLGWAWPSCFETHRSAFGLWKCLRSRSAATLLRMRATVRGAFWQAKRQRGREEPTCGCGKRSSTPLHCFRIVIYNGWRNSDVSSRQRTARSCRRRGPREFRGSSQPKLSPRSPRDAGSGWRPQQIDPCIYKLPRLGL